ncbi:hypothetical protein P3339_02950 [Microbulbifer sp. MLAF003]|uniref:hypothetical protein n=1 Tax=Microbulbifer sp. MLAF003 TaxID=3032582 RepID=UPI0024AD053C|nr:hypothetical protein [Microbulbifer sp. MLAF003]WHI51805.1 hypothetical protein P3339_02950 [Microbulbifer sp. MLAF003]
MINFPHEFNTYNLHTHGLHVSPESPGDNVCMKIPPGENFTYEYDIPKITRPASTGITLINTALSRYKSEVVWLVP